MAGSPLETTQQQKGKKIEVSIEIIVPGVGLQRKYIQL